MNKQKMIESYIKDLEARYPRLEKSRETILRSAELLIKSVEAGGKILICGNGGSSADADHIVGELMKGFLLKRPLTEKQKKALINTGGDLGKKMSEQLQQGVPAISLSTHSALNTAFMNDVNPDFVFAQQVLGIGRPGDLLWGLSTSGNSRNVVAAATAAKAAGLNTIAMTGSNGGQLTELCDQCIRVDETETYKVQELHLPVYHTLCLIVEDYFFA